MLNTRIVQGLLALAVVVASGSLWAKKPVIDESMWIVELEDAPTIEFRGEVPQSVAADGRAAGKVMAATAPSVTGERRLRVESPAVREYVQYLDGQRVRVLERASAELGMVVKPRFVYRHLRNGFAAPMSRDEAMRLAELPGVRSVQPDIIQHVHTDAGPGWIGAPDLWSGATGAPNPTQGEGTVLGVIDTGVNWESIFFDVSLLPSPMTNPRGQFFGLCSDAGLDIACNEKLIGVYDFTDEDTNGFDPDGHGSHVASTAVGIPLGFELNFGTGPIAFQTSGVAPRASFIAYKACEADPDAPAGNFVCPGTATSAALEQAIVDGVDAVNFSIGGDPFSPWSPQGNQRVFLNLREAGIVPVTSAGNSGPEDFTVGSPANVPWVMAVGNAEHGRILANRLINVSGGPFALGNLVGQGITGSTVTLPIVHARDFGNALCGQGPAESGPTCGANTGASNPFPPGTFDGQIVVCDRGDYGRVEKGKNVQLAGAAGMILANTQADGESTSADQHCLPATHVGAADGDRLRDWLDTGSGQQGRLTGTQRFVDDSVAGRLNDSSSRGPAIGAPDVMKPNVTGPGTFILAAGTETDGPGTGPGAGAANQILFLTGTSMSSPHVAGAALLLRSANPDWGVDEVLSALETTAAADIVRNSDDSEARVPDRGAGGVQVDLAAQAGLYLPVSEADFLDANPFAGGDPAALNLPGIFSENCVGTCSFTRTLRALGPGTWNVTAEGALDVQVTPSSFTLGAGQQRELQIEVSRGAVALGEWGAGSVVLTPTGGAFTTQRLPVGALIAAGEVPGPQSFTSQTNRGRGELTIPELVDVEELVVRTSALLRPTRQAPTLAQDPTPSNPFDGAAGVVTEIVEVPADALLLYAETFASTASDIDLYIGRDENGDGNAQENEIVCSSLTFADLERCDVEFPEAGDWWVLVQNFSGGGFNSTNDAPFEFAVFAEARDPSLVVTAPGAHPGGPLTIPVYWDQPAMKRGEGWQGVVAIASSPAKLADVGVVPVRVTRTGDNNPAETALFEGRPEPVVLPSGATHDLMYIDVPPDMNGLSVTVEGSVSDVTIRRRGFDELAATVPFTPPAPAQVLAQAAQSGGEWTVNVADPQGGRYFVVIDNDGPTEVDAVVTASVESSVLILDPPPPASSIIGRGAWGAEARSINQGIDWQVGGGGRFAIWYTYDEDGVPTFYITDTVPVSTQTTPIGGVFFNAVLFRPTSNDVRSSLAVVGEVQVTQIAEGRMMYAWRLNGNHGAEMFAPVSGNTCPTIPSLGDEPVPLLGTWFSPDTTAGGSTVLITADTEAWIRFYYDNDNSPRWIIADTELPPTLPGGNRMEVLDFRGFCIYCDEGPITNEVIGTLERVFIDESRVREVSDYVAGAPIDTSIENDRELVPLSFPFPSSCPNQ